MADSAEATDQEVKPETEKPVSETTSNKDESSSKPNEDQKEQPTDLEQKIIRQIEYYFGDFNLVKDKFMQTKIKENDGWIPLAVLLTFNRLKALTEDAEVVVQALKKSPNNVVHVNEDNSKIRRNPERELPEHKENWKEEEWTRTVYVKGFPVDATMDVIMSFLQNEGKVMNVFMKKKFHSKTFKGSVFATFETKDEAETFAKKEGQKYKSTILIKEMRHDYQTRKQNEFVKRKEDREKRKLEKKEKNAEEDEELEINFDPEKDMKKDCLMKLTGFVAGISREDIKEKLSPHAAIAYVDYNIGDTEAVVRFEEGGVAKGVLEKAQTGEEGEKKLVIKDAEISASFLEGDEEVEYWKKIIKSRSHVNRERKNHKRRGGGGGYGRGGKSFRGGRGDSRGGWRGGRGRGRDRREGRDRNGDATDSDRKRPAPASEGDAPPDKREKVDS